MSAIQTLVRLAPEPRSDAQPAASSPPRETSLMNILSPDQINDLLGIFDQKYTPWLNFTLIRRSNASLLDTICCTLAIRYLDPSCTMAQPTLKTQLQNLTEDVIFEMIVNPRISESIEAVQALLILSLWEPLGRSPESEGRDGRVLVTSAVSMAMNLHLHQASTKADGIRKAAQMTGGYMPEDDVVTLNEMLEHARLWTSITNTESMLCLGTGRVPLSRRSADDKKLFRFPEDLDGRTDYRDLRLGLIPMQAEIAEAGVAYRMRSNSETEDWYDKMDKSGLVLNENKLLLLTLASTLESLKRGRRFLLPLPVVLDHERFYFHVLHLYDGICRLLVLYHGIWEARRSVGHIPLGESWHQHFKPRGQNVVADWGRDMIQTAEAVLVYTLQADAALLSTAPDNFFVMVALAAGYVVGVKFLMALTLGGAGRLLGGSDLLLAQTVTHLGRAACEPAHVGQKCAVLIARMLSRWENRHLPRQPQPTHGPRMPLGRTTYSPPDLSQSDSSGSNVGSYYSASPLPVPPELDFFFLDNSLALDSQFWQDMQQNHSAGYLPR